jgi:hypothetical protein
MQLTSKQDIDAPADFVYAQLMDFESWERAAMRRGIEVDRTDKLPAPGLGMSWAVKFRNRGRDRKMGLKVVKMDEAGQVSFGLTSVQTDGVLGVELVPMAAKHTRVFLTIDVLPKTFTAKLFVQSLRLAKARVDKKLADRARLFATEIEDRYRRSQVS